MNYLCNSTAPRGNNRNAIRVVATTAFPIGHGHALVTGNPKTKPLGHALSVTPKDEPQPLAVKTHD